ncbi:MAG: hypothetical protein ABJB47_05960 [Actinomycetota bacterium]
MPELGRQASTDSGPAEPESGDSADGPDSWPAGSPGPLLSPEHQAWLDDEANIWPDDGAWSWPDITDDGGLDAVPGLPAAALAADAPSVYEPPAYEAPAYEAPVYEPPAYEAPVYSAPAYELPADLSPAYEQPELAEPVLPPSGYELPDYDLMATASPAAGVPAPALPADLPAVSSPGTGLAVIDRTSKALVATGTATADAPPAHRRGPLFAVGRQARNLLALALYTGLSLELFGHWILAKMSDLILSAQPQDGSLFVWAFRWWTFASTHNLGEFYSKWNWAPSGVNLTWATTIPGPAFVLSWLTNGHGPFFAYNVAELAAPALGSWTAYLLCRRITGSFFPALLGGFFFGFSPSVIDEFGQGHPSLTLVFLVPVAAYLVVALLQGTLPPLVFMALLGVVLATQIYIGTEVYAMMTLVGGLAAITGYAFSPAGRRKRLLRALLPTAGAYVLSAVLAYPLLTAAFTGPRINKAIRFSTIQYGVQGGSDFLRYFTPGKFTLFWSGFGRQWGDNPWYLGIPLVVVIILFTVTERRRRTTWPLLVAIFAALLISLGSTFSVFGLKILPWQLFALLPTLNIAQPGRVITYIFLLIAVLVAMWLAQAKRSWLASLRWLLVLGAGVMILPNFPSEIWTTSVPAPSFFTTGAYRHYIPPGQTVWIVESHPDRQLIWQAQADFYFRLPGGFFGGVPTGGPRPQPPNTAREERLAAGEVHPGTTIADITNFLVQHRVETIVASQLPYPVIQEIQAATGLRGARMLGVRLFQLGPHFTPPVPGTRLAPPGATPLSQPPG